MLGGIGCIMPGAIGAGGFQTMPRMPPTIPKISPMMNPPPLMMLNSEKSRMITPAATWLCGFIHNITAPTSTRIAKMRPTAP